MTATAAPRAVRPWIWLVAAWLGARALVFAVWAAFGLNTQYDVLYYWHRVHLLVTGVQPVAATLIEYPTPVIWILELPYVAALGSRPGFVVAYVIFMLLLDLAFAVALWRAGGRWRVGAVAFWIAFTLMLGPTAYMRFDLIPAVLGGGALLAMLGRRSGLAGGLIGLGAAIKLWPALLWPATMADDRRAKTRASIGFWTVGAGLALASLVYGGWNRLISPLTWQSDRGLQIESIWATAVMAARAATPTGYVVEVSKYQAFEITGPGTSAWLTAASVSTVLGMLAIGAAYLLWLRRDRQTFLEAALIMLSVIAVTIVTNKTFSPQYMMWLGGPAAAMILIAGRVDMAREAVSQGQVRTLAWWVLGLTLTTQFVYPILYDPLVHGGSLMGLATTVLVVRNAAMVVFTGWLLLVTWRMLRRRPA